MRRLAASALVGLCVVAVPAAPALASTFVVTKTTDGNDGTCDGDCSLREAIALAGTGDTVVLSSNANTVYSLSLGALVVTHDLTIAGNGSAIDGGSLDRVFDIQGLVSVTLNDVTVQHGKAIGTLSLGGGIRIGGGATVVLNNCTVKLNDSATEVGSADPGGGIAAIGSYAAATGIPTFTHLTLTNSQVLNNTGSNGGGIACVLCTLTLNGSTLDANSASATDGGGVMMVGTASSLAISQSTVTSNTSASKGGGISVPFGAGTVTIDRS